MDYYPQARRSSQDSTHSSASGASTPHKETASPLSEPLKMSSSSSSSPTQPQSQQTARKNPPIVRYVMDSAPADFSACKHCCQCGTILAISNWCIDCRHFECTNC